MYQDNSYVVSVKKKNHNIRGMYISTENGTSFRPINSNMIFIGGEGHKVGDNSYNVQDVYMNLINYAKEIFNDCDVEYYWENQDCITLDKVPYIGEFSNLLPKLYVATGYNKWGMTNSHIAANILSDAILERKNEYAKIYNATRLGPIKNHKELGNMVKETYNSLIANRIKNSNYTIKDIGLDQGGVIEYEGEKVGVYKDKNGRIHAIKPYCKHLGCLLTWNNLEKTWDCPCHGSKYDYLGNVIYAPTVENLDMISLE